MQQRKLGTAGPLSSAVGLGCMGMSEFYGERDDASSLRTLARALELGVAHFDTADTYGFGRNEELLARFIADAGATRRGQIVIATKFGIVRSEGQYERRIDNSPTYIRSACEASLRRLGVDRIDLFYCHRRDPSVPIEAVVSTMAELVREGKVGSIGLSEVSAATLERAHRVHPIAALQSEYSLWSREAEQGTLQLCRELGIAFVAYSPLGRAFLTGPVDINGLAADDFRRSNPRFNGEAAEKNLTLVQELEQFAKASGMSASQVALAWILNKHPHVVPIPGSRRIANLESNVQATFYKLSQNEIAYLDSIFQPEKVSGQRYPEAGFVGIESD